MILFILAARIAGILYRHRVQLQKIYYNINIIFYGMVRVYL